MALHTMLVYRNQQFGADTVQTGMYSQRMAVAGGQLSYNIFAFSHTSAAVRRARGGEAQWRRSETSFPNRLAAARSRAWRWWRRGDYCPAAKRCGPSGLRTFGSTTRSQGRGTRPKRGSDERTTRAVPNRAIALRSRSERSVSDMASGRGPGRRADAVTAVTRPAAT